ncbi:MAG: DUF72 domain-containing protein [Pseudomonadota bacterium]|nr:DUF72 domain-containing protein [Pseudomonadota bacterium]
MKPTAVQPSSGSVHVGVGGWTYEPWRETFYPPKLAKARELEYASRHLSAIEINATYYGTQKRESFAKWRSATPAGFVFSVKASRYATNRKLLGEAGESIERFVGSGLAELGEKLGPLVWQFATSKAFDPGDFEAFLRLLPATAEGVPLRHVMEVRHPSFKVAEYVELARRHQVATVFADSDDFPSFADLSADFVYARLMRTRSEVATGYSSEAIDAWAKRIRQWSEGAAPADLPNVRSEGEPAARARDVYVFFISGAKERAPAAAVALLEALGWTPPLS